MWWLDVGGRDVVVDALALVLESLSACRNVDCRFVGVCCSETSIKRLRGCDVAMLSWRVTEAVAMQTGRVVVVKSRVGKRCECAWKIEQIGEGRGMIQSQR